MIATDAFKKVFMDLAIKVATHNAKKEINNTLLEEMSMPNAEIYVGVRCSIAAMAYAAKFDMRPIGPFSNIDFNKKGYYLKILAEVQGGCVKHILGEIDKASQ